MKSFIPILLAVFPFLVFGTNYDPVIYETAGEYTYMWWAQGFRDPSLVFNIQTSRYGLSFDYNDFDINTFGPVVNPQTEDALPFQDNSVVNGLPVTSLRCSIETQGTLYDAVSADSGRAGCMLVESGKYFQRRWLNDITLENGAPAGKMHLEIAAWPDRISFLLYFVPEALFYASTLTPVNISV